MSNLSEEEKEAIEELGHYEFRSKTIYNNKIDKADVRDSKIILKLIDRLQKELEQEKFKRGYWEERVNDLEKRKKCCS